MLIFWKVLPIYQNNFDIFANLYIFYLEIKKSCCCKNLDIFPLKSEIKYTLCRGKFHVLKCNLRSIHMHSNRLSQVAIAPGGRSVSQTFSRYANTDPEVVDIAK